jgi:methionyl-tRNA formyltransferase
MSRGKKKVYLFVGNDVTAHLIMNQVVRGIIEAGVFRPVIVCTKDTNGPKEKIDSIVKFGFYEKTLLQKHVYPFINQTPFVGAENRTPQQFKSMGIEVLEAENVNDPNFVERLETRNGIAAAISIRCTQIFHKDIVDVITKHGGYFLNIHSGILPHYRGVMPTARLLADKLRGAWERPDYGCSLHHVDPFDKFAEDKGIDTGNVLTVDSIRLDTNKTLWELYADLAPVASTAILNAMQKIAQGQTLHGTPQHDYPNRTYYSFPTANDVSEWEESGLKFVDEKRVVRALVRAFSRASDSHGKELAKKLAVACASFKEASTPSVPSQAIFVPELRVA